MTNSRIPGHRRGYDGRQVSGRSKTLTAVFPVAGSKLFEKKVVKAVDNVSFGIRRGEDGLPGSESGTVENDTTGRTLLRLYEPTDGTILYDGKDITREYASLPP